MFQPLLEVLELSQLQTRSQLASKWKVTVADGTFVTNTIMSESCRPSCILLEQNRLPIRALLRLEDCALSETITSVIITLTRRKNIGHAPSAVLDKPSFSEEVVQRRPRL